LPFLERTVLINMFDNVIAEKSNKRLLIFTRQENNVQGCIVVKSPDTEVFVLYVHYFPKMKNTSELWFQTGLITSTKDCRRYIPVGVSFRALNIDFFPIPKNEEVVSHPVRACKISHTTELNDLHNSCTGI
jgi:hypothetical protein